MAVESGWRAGSFLVPWLGACALFGCADETAPRFEPGALEAEVTASEVTLRWPAASDDVGVARYVVSLDGAELARLDGEARTYVHEGLEERSRHEVGVVAYDAAGNASWELRTALTTPDATPPRWPEDASLVAQVTERDGDRGVVRIEWPAAEDEGGVARYRVVRAGVEVATVEDGSRAHGFAPGALDAARFAVIAEDDSGNASAPLALDWEPPAEPALAEAPPPSAADRAGSPLLRILGATGGSGSGDIFDALRSPDTGDPDDTFTGQ